jgi:hypothetical protein
MGKDLDGFDVDWGLLIGTEPTSDDVYDINSFSNQDHRWHQEAPIESGALEHDPT